MTSLTFLKTLLAKIYTFILFFASIYHTGSKKAHKIALDRVEDHKGKKETRNWNVVSWFLNPFSFLGFFKNRILKVTNDAGGHISILGHLWLSTPQDGGFSGMIYNTVCRTSPEYLSLQVGALQKTIRKEISLEPISLNWNEIDTSCDHCRRFAPSLGETCFRSREPSSKIIFPPCGPHFGLQMRWGPGARFSKVPIINGPGKLFPRTLKI